MAGSVAKGQAESAEKARAGWDSTSEAALIEGLQNAVRKGQKSDNNFKTSVYQTISVDLKKLGYKFDHKQVKSRWTRFTFSGFGWDEVTKCVTASEKVWQGVLYDENGNQKKNFSHYNYYRGHCFILYNEVTEIIGGSTAKGPFAFSSTSTEQPLEGNRNEGDDLTRDSDTEQLHTSDATSTMTSVATTPVVTVSSVSVTRKRAATPPSSPTPKRYKPTSSTQIGSLCESVNRLVSGIVPTPRKDGHLPTKSFELLRLSRQKKDYLHTLWLALAGCSVGMRTLPMSTSALISMTLVSVRHALSG
ncbi:hypothetical protein F5050DRAFT_1716158 [Lentinula boryana]|uniref:Myb/SANT-like domain-containing protein n=1 Tax=Lentinula boryana TaxID=40481 RepID=A0ABQ8PYB4_9AGAR|nr:hypothetical protein F5050DRAFT_1716158 [Lentinula boryana]